MAYKFVNQTTSPIPWTGRYFKYDGLVYANPTDENLLLIGYKPITVSDVPEYDSNTHYVSPVYTERESDILQEWEVKEITL